jgi:4-hydroxybenzoate polyprenyltransferase
MDEGGRNAADTVVVVELHKLVKSPESLLEAFWVAASVSWSDALSALARHIGNRDRLRHSLGATALKAPARLAYCDDVIEMVTAWRTDGGQAVLVAAADDDTTREIAAHVGLFDAAHGNVTLPAGAASAELERCYGVGGYATIAPFSAGLADCAGPAQPEVSSRSVATPASLSATMRLLRPHQWLKNLLVFVPMLAAHQLTPATVWPSIYAFIAFSLIASATYVLNDLLDLNADRAHPRKRHRPLASGAVSVRRGTVLIPLLGLAGIGTALLAGPALLGMVLLYAAITTAYSFRLKRLVVIDICTLAVLYTLRILAGSAATDIPTSIWLLAFSTFFFFSLAAVKRQAELVDGIARGTIRAQGRGYHVDDLAIVNNIAASAGMVSVLVLALYANSEPVKVLYRSPEALWGVCLVLLFWNSRISILTQRGQMHDDPLVFAARDKVSLACGAVVAALALAGTWI